ncbi:MAG: hypothetical protein ACO2PN_29465 [Pyrobaculum sp.]|jgi:hypothetical protein
MLLEILLQQHTTTATRTYTTPIPGPDYQVVLPGGLAFTWHSAVTIMILAIVVLIETMKLFGRLQRLEAAFADVLKELAVVFLVVFFIMNLWQFIPVKVTSPDEVINRLQLVVDEAYCRVIKMEQCIANIRLTGPAGAYAGYAEAKFSKYKSLYEQAIWMYNQLTGLARYLATYGPPILAAGLLIYVAWLRKIGGIIIGIFTGLWVGLALLAGAVNILPQCYIISGMGSPIQISIPFPIPAPGAVWAEDFKPIAALGCDNRILSAIRYVDDKDYEKWQLALAYASLFLIAAPAIGAAVGYLLGL